MKIGLLDVDGHNSPNGPQMKYSTHFKSQGHNVERFNPFYVYDLVIVSKVFSFTPDYDFNIRADSVVHGGTGYAFANGIYVPELDKPLEEEIEHSYPDYELYGIKNIAYGQLTRGCPRGCGFCIVPCKEGRASQVVADLSEFWSGQNLIVLNDPNLLACKDKYLLLKALADSGAKVEFNQGLDVRFVDDDVLNWLRRIRIKSIHFAWDDPNDWATYEKLKYISAVTGWRRDKIIVYILINYNSSLEQDLERVYKVKELGFSPYIMIYNKPIASLEIRKLQRYVNNRYIFWSSDCPSFEEYQKQSR